MVLCAASRLALAAAGRFEWLADRIVGSTDKATLWPANPRDVHHILMWSMDRLGDVVRATPAIEALRSHFSSARLTVVAAGRAGAVLRESPCIGSHPSSCSRESLDRWIGS